MSPRRVAEHEVQRILALVPWIVAHPGATKAEIAGRFALSAEQLDEDLDLMLMIGVPPYSPGDYIDVETDGERVWLRLADSFKRPVRLTAAEGIALLAAGRALLAVPGSDPAGPLAHALARLEAALDLPEVRVDLHEPGALAAVRAAVERHERIEIDYWGAGRDRLTTRRVDPDTVFFALGNWYLAAYCHQAAADRLFRVDRIRALRPTGEHFEAEPGRAQLEAALYTARPDDPRVVLHVARHAGWIVERYPCEAVSDLPDGRLAVTLAVSEPAFLERLLLRLGPDVEVAEPDAMRDAGARAAARVLARYTGSGSGVGSKHRA